MLELLSVASVLVQLGIAGAEPGAVSEKYHCEDGLHHVGASWWWYPDAERQIVGVQFIRSRIGRCAPPDTIPSVPIEPTLPGIPYERAYAVAAFEPPSDDAAYEYHWLATYSDGAKEPFYSCCDASCSDSTLGNCVDAPILRGVLQYAGPKSSVFAPCPGECWLEFPPLLYDFDLEQIEQFTGLSGAELSGRLLTFYGRPNTCRLLSDPIFNLTRIDVAETGECVPLSGSGVSWGSMRGSFR